MEQFHDIIDLTTEDHIVVTTGQKHNRIVPTSGEQELVGVIKNHVPVASVMIDHPYTAALRDVLEQRSCDPDEVQTTNRADLHNLQVRIIIMINRRVQKNIIG